MTNTKNLEEKIIKISVQITQDTFQDFQDYFAQHGYSTEEGLRILLGAGLGSLSAQILTKDQDLEREDNNNELLIRRLIQKESSLAATRFRMFEMEKANQNWKLSSGAIYAENEGLSNLAKRHLSEITELRKKLIEKESLIERLQEATEPGIVDQTPTKEIPGWKKVVLKILGLDI